jgi:hypothetical protein
MIAAATLPRSSPPTWSLHRVKGGTARTVGKHREAARPITLSRRTAFPQLRRDPDVRLHVD